MQQAWWEKIFTFKRHQCVCHAQAKSLCEAGVGKRFRVEGLCAEEGTCERLREMGFCESAVVEKVTESGALICKVCDAKVILSRALAEKIIVKDICLCQDHEHHHHDGQ